MTKGTTVALGNFGLLFAMLGIIVSLGAISGWSYIYAAFSAWLVGVFFVVFQWVVGRSSP